MGCDVTAPCVAAHGVFPRDGWVDCWRWDGAGQSIILGTFEGGSEETKTAAAYSLGHIAVGNMEE